MSMSAFQRGGRTHHRGGRHELRCQAQPEPLPRASRGAATRGRDPADGPEQDGDRRDARHFPQHLYDILRERKPVSPVIAVRLGKLFGDGAWTRMLAAYNTWQAERQWVKA